MPKGSSSGAPTADINTADTNTTDTLTALDIILFVPKRVLAILMGFLLFPVKSLVINMYGFLLTLTALLFLIPVTLKACYESILQSTRSKIAATIVTSFALIGEIAIAPVVLFLVGTYWLSTTLFDICIYQPYRGLHDGISLGLENVFEQLFSFTDSKGGSFFGMADGSFNSETDQHISNFSSYLNNKNLGSELEVFIHSFTDGSMNVKTSAYGNSKLKRDIDDDNPSDEDDDNCSDEGFSASDESENDSNNQNPSNDKDKIQSSHGEEDTPPPIPVWFKQ